MAALRKLVVEIIGARNLVSIDGTGSASAFCTLNYDQNQMKTKTKNKDLSPSWRERFEFPYGDGLGVLDINVYNEREGGTRRHGFLGRVQIKVPDVKKQGQGALQWLRLEKWSIFSRMKGELGVHVWYEGPKPPPPEPKLQPKSESKEPPPSKHVLAPPKKDAKSSLVKKVTPAEFKVKDVIRKTKETALDYQHNDDLVEPMQYLYVKVVKARNLAAKGADGTSNPYVKVSVWEVSAQTQGIPKDLNPEWDRVFAFSKDKLQGQFVEISVWDADLNGAYHFLGALSFLLEEIPSRKPPESPLAPLWYTLEERPGKTGVKGELMMALWMGNRADEAFQVAWYPDTDGHAHLRSKVYRSPTLWYLRVTVLEAKDLYTSEAQTYRYPHPFVGINLGPVQTKRVFTPSARGTNNPVWNKDLLFVAAEPFDELLVVTVKDRVGPNKDEVMGVARISIDSALQRRLDIRQQMNSSWFDLEATDKGVFRGRIHLRLHFEGGYHVLDESPDYTSCTRPTAEQPGKPLLGTLELGIIGANHLLPMHKFAVGRGVTDAYCVAKYGQNWFRTSTITDNYYPKWNDQYTWEVYDPFTVLTVCVFDNRHVHSKTAGVKDTPIGKVRIRLSALEIDRVYTNAYPLLVVTASGIKKMGELELSIRFSSASTAKVLRAYLQPPLPAMHYYAPIEESDMENLRIGAMNLVWSRLARFDHPLRQEVVQFILDTESYRWSMRRSKANYFRLANVLASLFAMQKYIDDVRCWKNPVTTVFYHIVFLILIWYPVLCFPLVYLYMFLIGAWNYRFRPRRPPSIDSQLSQGGEEPIRDLDELEEEFNIVTPANMAEEVLKRRYERLRGFAGRIQYFIGEVSTQGERLQSLLSWRDPRATFIFVTFCLIAGIVHFVRPFRVVAQVLIVFYVLRHPKFRDPFPSVPLNFFRHLPSLSDRIL